MTISGVPAHYDATCLTVVEALRNVPLTGTMHRDALVKMADSILAQLPEASDAVFYTLGVTAERERIAELADAWDREAEEMRAESVRTGLHPALAHGHVAANALRERAAGLRSVLSEQS